MRNFLKDIVYTNSESRHIHRYIEKTQLSIYAISEDVIRKRWE